MGTVTKWPWTEVAAAKPDLLLRQIIVFSDRLAGGSHQKGGDGNKDHFTIFSDSLG